MLVNSRQKFVMGNWKMHGNLISVQALSRQLLSYRIASTDAVKMVVFPPFIYLSEVSEILKNSCIAWGGQNICSYKNMGAYTGETSAAMLKDLKCSYTLIGHSERRQYYHETDQDILEKFLLASQAGIKSVLCVGETLEEYQQQKTKEKVLVQLKSVIKSPRAMPYLDFLTIAYEPLWAIGSGLSATPEQAQTVHQFIREAIKEIDENLALTISLLYGGSVNAVNAKQLLTMPDIDGGLVGGASLSAEDFHAIYQSIVSS